MLTDKTKQKIFGYILRLTAVFLWGVSPLIIKYYLARINGLFITAFSVYIGLISLLVFFLLRRIFLKSSRPLRAAAGTGYTKLFFLAVIFDGLTVLLYFLSIQLTLASNAILFLTFAPVVAVLISLIFFRDRVSYLRVPGHASIIIFVFLAGCIGTSFLILNKGSTNVVNYHHKLLGDALAILALMSDVIATMSIIHYAKSKQSFSGLDFIFRKVAILAAMFTPIVLLHIFSITLTLREWGAFLFLGLFNIVVAYYCAYEAFQRIEGLIAYLLFNLTAVVTIFLEILFFGLEVTVPFVIGSVLIIAASITAESINTKSEPFASNPS